jgi:hypothetical protein
VTKKYREYVDCRIKWADHFVEHGDTDLETVKKKVQKPAYGVYRGVIVAQSKQMIALCPNVWEEEDGEDMDTLSDPMYIMKTAIVDIKYFEDEEKS